MIDRRNSIAVEKFLRTHAPGVEESRRADFSRLIQIAGKQDVIRRAREILNNERSLAAVDHLDKIYSTLDSLGLGENFDVDLGDTGGLEYYTGLTFKVYAPGCGAEIGGGGRYDKLVANFGEPEPAVGFSIALDGLVGAISMNDDKLPWRSAGEVETISFDADPARAFEQAREMRKLGKQVKISGK